MRGAERYAHEGMREAAAMKLFGYAMDVALAVVLLGLMCAFAGVEALTGGGR